MKLLIVATTLFSSFLIVNASCNTMNNEQEIERLQEYYQNIADKENKLNEELNNGVYEIDAYEACLFATSNNDNYCNRIFNLGGI